MSESPCILIKKGRVMVGTVNSAFNLFNKDTVNLDPKHTKLGRSSRDWLLKQLCTFDSDTTHSFPYQYASKHINFGSFARHTKIAPLDDIDLMFCLTADNAYYTQYGSQYVISTPNAGVRLKAQSNNDILNSIKVLNIFKNSLSNIGQYNNAEIHRRGEAVTLQLQSYSWNFDIVPCFFTDTQLYLIPDGNGHWKATNPKVDQECITAINLDNKGKALQLIRTLKYWNRHHSSHTLNSYLFEQFVLNFINSKTSLSDFIDFSIRDFFLLLIRCDFPTRK